MINLIDTVEYNLGGFTENDILIKDSYIKERETLTCRNCPISWTGYVGLMYPSDYGVATSGGKTNLRLECLDTEFNNWNNDGIKDCQLNDWLYSEENDQWTITNLNDTVATVAAINTDGNLYYSGVANGGVANTGGLAVFPVVYLKSSVKITAGKGTKEEPFQLSL